MATNVEKSDISKLILVLMCLFGAVYTDNFMECIKRPIGTETPQTKADGRFTIEVLGTVDKTYLPNNNYTVVLKGARNSQFTSFLIMADGEYQEDKLNSRNHYFLKAGTLRPKQNSAIQTQNHPGCKNAVQQSNNAPKSFVEVEWLAPEKRQGCVTIHAMVVENQDVWYMDDGPLTTRICEDTRKIIDIEPIVIEACTACEEAKYEITFEGQWFKNTHPRNFPETASMRFSDLVGASHSSQYYLWDYDVKATPGLKLLAEAANTTLLENEIQQKFDGGVRTLIKASGKVGNHMSEPTSAIFRADHTNHLMSIATSIVPSPDWFLGVTHFELCSTDGKWVNDRELNLYLIDAGTDNGVSYESSNEETLPPGLIKRIKPSDNKNSPFCDTQPPGPFAKIRIRLLRVYRETCDKGPQARGSLADVNEDTFEPSTPAYIPAPAYTNYNILQRLPEDTTGECTMTDWSEWSQCEPECGEIRYKLRQRFHVVNGIEIRYHKNKPGLQLSVPEHCKSEKMLDTLPCDPELCAEN